jgi:hypothetical protein
MKRKRVKMVIAGNTIRVWIQVCRKCGWITFHRKNVEFPRCTYCRASGRKIFIKEVSISRDEVLGKPVSEQVIHESKPAVEPPETQKESELLDNITGIFAEVFNSMGSISAVESKAEELFEKYYDALVQLGITSKEDLILRCFKI